MDIDGAYTPSQPPYEEAPVLAVAHIKQECPPEVSSEPPSPALYNGVTVNYSPASPEPESDCKSDCTGETCESDEILEVDDPNDSDYMDDGKSESSEGSVEYEDDDYLKKDMKDSFKLLKRIYGNFGIILESLEQNKKNMAQVQLERGEMMAICMKIDMAKKSRKKMVDCLIQIKDIAMEDNMSLIQTGERLCDLNSVRENLIKEQKTLEGWSKDRLQELGQRIDFLSKKIAKLERVKIVLMHDGQKKELRANHPIWRLARSDSSDTLHSETYAGQCACIRYIVSMCQKEMRDHKWGVSSKRLTCGECTANMGGDNGKMCESLNGFERQMWCEIEKHESLVKQGWFSCEQCENEGSSGEQMVQDD